MHSLLLLRINDYLKHNKNQLVQYTFSISEVMTDNLYILNFRTVKISDKYKLLSSDPQKTFCFGTCITSM